MSIFLMAYSPHTLCILFLIPYIIKPFQSKCLVAYTEAKQYAFFDSAPGKNF